MANPEHLAILEQGVEVWNKWREKNWYLYKYEVDLKKANLSEIHLNGFNLQGVNLEKAILVKVNLMATDLSKANLSGANLMDANLSRANLSWARIVDANLIDADLSEANLFGANLMGANIARADLQRANLKYAYLYKADFYKAKLYKSNLTNANLTETDLYKVDLYKADLYKAVLTKANMREADLQESSLIDANLDETQLTGARLWEAKRSGWSVQNIICEYAYFDREGIEKTEFKPGEFEKLYSEKTKIVLHYKDGISPFEVTTLPALIKLIENKHPGTQLHLKSIQEDAGGVAVSIVVDELGETSIKDVQRHSETLQQVISELKDEQRLRFQFESQVQVLKELIKEKMGDTYNVHQVTGVVKAESSTVSQIINTNDLAAISKLISDILAARTEIETVLPSEQANEFNAAFEIIQEQASVPQKNWEKMKQAAQSVKNVLMSAGEVAGKWIPIVEKLAEAVHKSSMV